jgi:hypothetical protein
LFAAQVNCLDSLRGPPNFIQGRRVFQSGCVAEFFAQVRGAHDAAHDFCISRFWYVADEQNFLGSERFAKLGGERVF